MARYECSVCGYVYDEQAEGEQWQELPDDWPCPVCGAAKSEFRQIGGGPAEEETSPVEEETHSAEVQEEEAPVRPQSRALMAHRVFGYVFLVIYLVLLVQMMPRLWNYQIEFPARTVLHIALGMAVGVVLALKIAVVRFFRRLEVSLVPNLGTFLLVASVVLIGISVPTSLREALATTRLFDEGNLERVRTLLAQTGELDEAEARGLVSPNALRAGRDVLRQECVDCHDLRTVLARPRTPENWRQTVRRMADRMSLVDRLEDDKQWQVTAYLVAISPQLQQSARQLREQRDRQDAAQKAAAAVKAEEVKDGEYEPAAAKRLFEKKCSQCHLPTLVKHASPSSEEAARELVARMVSEGLTATEDEIAQIVRYLTETHVKVATP